MSSALRFDVVSIAFSYQHCSDVVSSPLRLDVVANRCQRILWMTVEFYATANPFFRVTPHLNLVDAFHCTIGNAINSFPQCVSWCVCGACLQYQVLSLCAGIGSNNDFLLP